MDDRELPLLEEAIGKIWDKAHEMGLDPFPTHFEIVPATILYEFGAYLLPGRFSHWTHGKAWYLQGGQPGADGRSAGVHGRRLCKVPAKLQEAHHRTLPLRGIAHFDVHAQSLPEKRYA